MLEHCLCVFSTVNMIIVISSAGQMGSAGDAYTLKL